MEDTFLQILIHLQVNKTNFHMKGFALGLALKQRRKATRKSPIHEVRKGMWAFFMTVLFGC